MGREYSIFNKIYCIISVNGKKGNGKNGNGNYGNGKKGNGKKGKR